MTNKADILIVGSGLGGLICGCILAKAGKKVIILEKNRQLGGNLQTFVRHKCIFDTGVHYLGGLAPGQTLWKLFQFLGLKDLPLQAMDPDGFDRIQIEGDPVAYPYAQGFDAFIEKLSAYFPAEKEGLAKYIAYIKSYQHAFPLFQLSSKDTYWNDLDWAVTVDEIIAQCTTHPVLQAVLAGNNFLYAGQRGQTPFYVHALSVGSYLSSAWRCIKGGSQLAKGLAREIRAHGGTILTRQEVLRMEGSEDRLHSVFTAQGKVFEADAFIVNVHPRQWMRKVEGINFKPHYTKRIAKKKDTISSFSLFLVLNPQTIPYKNHNLYWFDHTDAVWDATAYLPQQWPRMYMLSMTESRQHPGYAESATILTYMRFEEVAPWADSFHTVDQPVECRNESYAQFKKDKSEQLLAKVALQHPQLISAIKAQYSATPLSYRDYIGNETGDLYGFEKSVNEPFPHGLPTRTKIANVFQTGQHVHMHGITGVAMSALVTCGEWIDRNQLLAQIRAIEP
jgi:all-trans-retinol 13,14-reductase